MNKKGFTLTEVLVSVIIVAILAVMAVPLYEKTIERSRLAEARTIMHRLQEAKLAAMDDMGCGSYSAQKGCPSLEHLRVAFTNADKTPATGYTFSTRYFQYSLGGSDDTYPNGICAKRLSGDSKDTIFAYYGFNENAPVFLCKGEHCEDYGFENTTTVNCTF